MIYPDTFDNSRKFIFSNWTDEDFDCVWAGETISVKKGETKEYEMFLAYHLCKHLVDREMNKDGHSAFTSVEEKRTPYEEKTIAELHIGTDSPALATLKEQIRKEVKEVAEKKVKKAPVKKVTKKEVTEFEDIN